MGQSFLFQIKNIRACLYGLMLLSVLSGCEMEEQFSESPGRNFDAYWKLLDENYCFFDYKNVDWKEVYGRYREQITESANQQQLFHILSKMTDELQDGHINIISYYYFYAYDGWYSAYPSNFNWNIVQSILNNGKRAGYHDEIRYKPLEDGDIGYIYYGSFSESILETELNGIFETFKNCKGLIVDIRNNGGGSLTNSDRFASRFTNKRVLCGYIQHKTGKNHNDFSDPFPLYLEPSSGNHLWLKPVILLTNRRCYSAANNFVSKMSILPNVRTLGDATGGGSGFPLTSELPNGWRVRFSSSPMLNIRKEHTEFGIEPDIKVSLDPKDEENNKDTLIEEAIRLLKEAQI